MSSQAAKRPSFVVVMGDEDRDLLDALKDHRESLQPHILEAHGVDDAVQCVLRARADVAVVPEDPDGQSHLEICRRIKRRHPRIATVVMREELSEIPPREPAVDDYVALQDGDEMMARINVLLGLRAYNARAAPIRDRILEAFRGFELSAELLDDGRLVPPAKVDCHALLDADLIHDHEAAVSRLGDTAFACYLYAPEPTCVCSSGRDGCLRGVCPAAQALHKEPGFTVAVEECHTAAWRCAREAMLRGSPQEALCPGGYRLAAFPIVLRFRSVNYPLLAVCVALPSPVDAEQLDRLAERGGVDPARLRRDVARRPLPHLSRVHLDALVRIEENVADTLSRQVSHEYATAFNVLVQAVDRWENDRALTRRSHQLQHANERLRELNRHKNEFLANVSHELKTPMTSIIGFTSLLLRGGAGPLSPKGEHFLDRVLANSRTLHAAINDILSLAQLGSRDVRLNPSTFDLTGLVTELVDEIRPVVEQKPIELHVELPHDLPPCRTDRDRLRQVLKNLLNNAAKFTNRGAIRVAARAISGGDYPRVAVAVTDTGVGLPAEALPHIFEEFRQVDGSSTRHHRGTGLGLSLVNRLIHLLGGEVKLDTAPDRGSTFSVIFPLDLPHFQRWRDALREQILAAEPDPADRSSPIVLAVSEDPQTLSDARRWCEPHGYRVASAFRIDQAFERAAALLPFAILVDAPVPSHDLWELADELRADPRTTDIPLVIVTALGGPDLAEALGANDWLPRAFDADALLNALDRLRPGDAGSALVIVGDAVRRDAIRRALRDAGYQVVACPTCRDASRFAAHPFDAILFDPEAEGEGELSALGSIRAGPMADAPAIAYVAPTCPPRERDHLAPQVSALIEQADASPADVVEAIARVRQKARSRPPATP